MRSERQYDAPQPQTYKCIVCGASVGTEEHAHVADRNLPLPAGRARIEHEGRLWEIWFTPASRYWCDAGIFCGPACGLAYQTEGGHAPRSDVGRVRSGPLPAASASNSGEVK